MQQDWDRVVMTKTTNKPVKVKPEQAVRDGSEVITEKKFAAGENKVLPAKNMAKLENETEELAHEKVPLSMAKAIQKARADKGMTQAQLAQAINEKPQVVNQYESGKAIPEGAVISKMEKALGTKLRPPKK
mmetsp:Transcript_5991/g.10783  ORF Transcript_5991/g.10783 Transcript_5991/m.10783 type:complete len:131 (-) Transcript_5991:174-566(-)